jgi:endonuclease YncB( thermonuclease family)
MKIINIMMLSSLFCCKKTDKAIIHQLKSVKNKEEMKCFSFKGQTFLGLPTNIYDGDTLSILFIYNGKPIKYRCRCLGYDSPEMKPSLQNSNRENEKVFALAAKTRFTELLNKSPEGIIRFECFDFDKYGRLLVKIWNQVDETCINDMMVQECHGKKYDGGKKESWV